jgi:Bacterial Ig-like domain (group 2)
MNYPMSKFCLGLATVVSLVGLTSCAHEQQLVSISVQPQTETFGAANIPVSANAGATVQLRAIGNYIHPPVSKDITNQVVWSSNTPDMVTVDASTGLITVTGQACGDTLISATVTTNHSIGNVGSSGAIVTGTMTASVVCFTGP